MTNLTPLRNFIQEPHCDLGDNAWRLADLVWHSLSPIGRVV